jgi:hypothetical protein
MLKAEKVGPASSIRGHRIKTAFRRFGKRSPLLAYGTPAAAVGYGLGTMGNGRG